MGDSGREKGREKTSAGETASAGEFEPPAQGGAADAGEVPVNPSIPQKFGYAFQGIAHGVKTQINVRIHLVATVLAVALALALRVPVSQLVTIVLLCAAVISAELMNTAIESVVDLVSPEYHRLAKAAKDCAAGAVLVLAIAAVVIGLVVYGEAILALLG
jgi:diacylglycerol kinase